MKTIPDLESEISELKPELGEGLSLEDIRIGGEVEVATQHRCYRLENYGNGQILISGHPKYCPQPVLVTLNGSTWGGSAMKMGFIGQDMLLEFRHPVYGIVRTSRIQAVRQLEHKSQSSDRLRASRN